jgi:hypothetical protein
MVRSLIFFACSITIFLFEYNQSMAQLPTGWRAHDLSRPLPNVVGPGEGNLPTPAPSDAIVLFDGTDLTSWIGRDGQETRWQVIDGAMQPMPGAGDIATRAAFGDCQLHLEWASPAEVKGDGQGRGNSGVYLMGQYEVQILDSFENPTYADGSAGSIYGQYPPLVNASRKPGQWQSYDIIFRKPRFDYEGKLWAAATITVLHNGVLIQDHESILGPTNWVAHDEYAPGPEEAAITLQDHGNPVRFRNIWIRKLTNDRPGPAKAYRSTISTAKPTQAQLDRIVGDYEGFAVQKIGRTLFLLHLGRQLEMVPVSETEFEFKVPAGNLQVQLDNQGSVQSISGIVDAAGKFSGKKK